MGYDAACTLTIDGQTFRGTARLEQKELIFRGDTRLVIPLAQIDEVHARGGSLFVAFAEQRAVLDIGTSAEKWVKRIANPPSRIEKLGVREAMRVAVINLEDDEFAHELDAGKAIVERDARGTHFDVIFVGVQGPGDLGRLAALARRIKPDGAIWVVRAKGQTATVTEAQSMAAGKGAGLVDVKVVSFSDTRSAEKYVIPVEKRGRPGQAASRTPRTRGRTSSRNRP
jgi:hypothetical protein